MVLHQDRDEEMIPSLLEFKHHLDTILITSFSSNDLFSQSLRESFEFFINRRRDKPAEYIAKYLDNLLRKGDKGLTTDATLEEEMDRVLILFRFVHGKDVFEAFYKKDLAKRLLLGKSASADAERSMLAKLKNGMDPSLSTFWIFHLSARLLFVLECCGGLYFPALELIIECGAQFTQKLEGMFKDIDISQDFIKSFKDQRHATTLEKGLHVNVLSQSWWPTYPDKQVRPLPPARDYPPSRSSVTRSPFVPIHTTMLAVLSGCIAF
jgi:cullin-4